MAVTKKPRGRWASRFHFLVRFLGLTGLMAAAVGGVLAGLRHMLPPWNDDRSLWDNARALGEAGYATAAEHVRGVIDRQPGELVPRVVVGLLVVGGAFALLALLVEVLVLLFVAAGRRSVVRFNAVLQVALVAALLVGVNVFSFRHYERIDLTRDQQFTLRPEVQQQLRDLKGETTIVVYQRHKISSAMTDSREDKPDQYDSAAERKVIEKVRDLVDQFREFGTRKFRVEVLDTESKDYAARLARLTKDAPRLRDAIDAAPEDTIFFYDRDGGKVQALSFNAFYQLDKTRSRERDNLVLLAQGVEPFANKVLKVEEKRPVVGVAVIHKDLSTTSEEQTLTLAGLRKALTARGFEVRDIILKRWGDGPPQPDVLTPQDSRLDFLEDDIAEYDAEIRELEASVKDLESALAYLKKASIDELNTKFRAVENGRPVMIDEPYRRNRMLPAVEREIDNTRQDITETKEALEEARKEKASLNLDAIAEARRMTDVRAKLERDLADCDLLIVPRITQLRLKNNEYINPRFYRLSDAHVAAFREFMKQGKPVLARFGPLGEMPQDGARMAALGPGGPDGMEDLLKDLGIRLGKETVLFTRESKRSLRGRGGLLGGSGATDVPAVRFDAASGTGRPLALRPPADRPHNPLGDSMLLTARSLGKDLDLRLQHPRPVYYEPEAARVVPRGLGLLACSPAVPFPASVDWGTLPLLAAGESKPVRFEPEFMVTDHDAWNADQPFASGGRLPTFKRPKDDDKEKNTLDERRRDSFPVGVALEASIPPEWDTAAAGAKTVRVVVIGHGHWFAGSDLKPAQERLLLNSCNWLLGRDEELPKDSKEWSYRRVPLTPEEKDLWLYGTLLALPLLFAYLGLCVLLVRRLR